MRRAGLTWDGDPRVKPPFGAAEIHGGHALSRLLSRGCWLFNEGAGAALVDSLGRTPGSFGDGAASRAPLWMVSERDRAVLFDGVDDNINLGTSAWLNPSYMTATCWIRPAATQLDNWGVFLARWFNSTSYHFSSGDGTTVNKLKIFINTTGGTQSVAAPTAMTANRWYHVAFTWDGATLRLYQDGVQVATAAHSGTLSSTSDKTVLGNKVTTGADNPFTGQMGLVTLSEAPALPGELLQLYAEPYAMLRPRVSRRYFVPAAAGGMLPYTPLRRRRRRRLLT